MLIVPEAAARDNRGMTDQEKMRKWVETWKKYGPELEAIRQQEVRDADNALSLAQLGRAFGESSGMIEMQRLFAKLRP